MLFQRMLRILSVCDVLEFVWSFLCIWTTSIVNGISHVCYISVILSQGSLYPRGHSCRWLPVGTLKDCEVAVSLCVHVQHIHVCVCESGCLKSCGTDYDPNAPAAELKQVVDLERRCLLLQCICLCCDGGITCVGITLWYRYSNHGKYRSQLKFQRQEHPWRCRHIVYSYIEDLLFQFPIFIKHQVPVENRTLPG